MNENKPVITPIGKQTWIVGEDFKVEVPISNNPDKAWAWGELYGGAYGHWVEDRSMLIIEGHADKEKSGHFIVFATKGSHKVQHTIYYDAVLKCEPIQQEIGLKEIMSLGYNVIATEVHTLI